MSADSSAIHGNGASLGRNWQYYENQTEIVRFKTGVAFDRVDILKLEQDLV